jgi:biotin synthase-related radical SAM superfamily protein
MADTQQVEARAERKVARLARQIDAFAKAHGGAQAQVAYLGERGARIVLVGEDGGWGDVVARTYEMAEKAVEKSVETSGITVHEAFDGELAAKVRTGAYEWKRMAGIQVGGPSNT